MHNASSHYVNADGIRTHYFDEGRGPVLILLHGGGAGADSYGNWRATLPLFAERYRTIAIDMVGFGETDKPDPATFEFSQAARVAHLRGFMQALNVPSAVLVGNSMGGATALGLAADFPAMVEKLILMGSAGLNTKIHDDLLPVINYDFSRQGMLRLIRALVNENFTVDEALIDYRHSKSLEPDTRRALCRDHEMDSGPGGPLLRAGSDFACRLSDPDRERQERQGRSAGKRLSVPGADQAILGIHHSELRPLGDGRASQ